MTGDSHNLSREIVALIDRYFILACEEDQADRSRFERARAGFKLLADEKSFDSSSLNHLHNAEEFSNKDPFTMNNVDRARNLIDENEGLANNLRRLLEENCSKDDLDLPERAFSDGGTGVDLLPDRRGMSEIIEAWRKNPAKLSLPEYLSNVDGRHDR